MADGATIWDVVTATAAIAAAGVGVFQLCESRKVSLDISATFKPSRYPVMSPDTPGGFKIQVRNKSKFAVGIADVGLVLKDGQRVSIVPTGPSHITGMPIRLDSRASHTFDFGDFRSDLPKVAIARVYAETECGTFKASKV